MKVTAYVLVINSKHATTIDAYASEAELDAALLAYCADNWDRWYDDKPMPGEAQEAIDKYWDAAMGEEWFQTEWCHLNYAEADRAVG